MTILAFALAALVQAPPPPPPAQDNGASEKRGLLNKSDAMSPGYTLFAPLRSKSTYLVDASGTAVHEWKSDAPPGQSVYLLPNGHLLRCERVDSEVFSGGGQGGRVREYDWDGALVWEYVCADATKLHHHDIEPMPNGNVLVIAWELKTEAECLAAGRSPQLLHAKELWPDMVLEIEPVRPSGGKVVWEWHAWDHLVQDRDEKLPGFGDVAASPQRIDVNISTLAPEPTKEELEELDKLRKLGYVGDDAPRGDDRGGPPGRGADWFHCNSIDYSPELDMIVLSSRELSELWFFDHSTTTEEARGASGGRWGRGGDLLFRWGNPRWSKAQGERTLFGQHDAQWISAGLPGAGNILVFNNGERDEREWSSADELAMPFTADTLKDAFAAAGGVKVELVSTQRSPDFCGHISGAQRLPNGNTLLCAGETARVIEFTPQGEVAWEFLSPYVGTEAPSGPGGRRGPPGGPPPDGDRRGPPGGPPPDGDRRGPPGGDRRGPPGGGRGPGGGGGPADARAIFRATRIAPDFPGVAALAKPAEVSEPAKQVEMAPAPAPEQLPSSGRVLFDGEKPAPKPLVIDAAKSDGCGSVDTQDQGLLVGANGGIANVVVTVELARAAVKAADKPLVLDQKTCRFEPHIAIVPVGTTVEYRNSDAISHNVHSYPSKNEGLNKMVGAGAFESQKLDKEDRIEIKCDIHPWMNSWLIVVNTNHFALTDAEGAFTLTGLPPGEHKARFWHEKLGKAEATLVVDAAGNVTPVEVKLGGERKGGRGKR